MRPCPPRRIRRRRRRLRRPSDVTLRIVVPRGGVDEGASPQSSDSTMAPERAICPSGDGQGEWDCCDPSLTLPRCAGEGVLAPVWLTRGFARLYKVAAQVT